MKKVVVHKVTTVLDRAKPTLWKPTSLCCN